jgi:hypothetical protein
MGKMTGKDLDVVLKHITDDIDADGAVYYMCNMEDILNTFMKKLQKQGYEIVKKSSVHDIDILIDKCKSSRDGSYETLEHCRKNLIELSIKWSGTPITPDNASDLAGNIYALNSVSKVNIDEIKLLTTQIDRAILVKEDLVRKGYIKKMVIK